MANRKKRNKIKHTKQTIIHTLNTFKKHMYTYWYMSKFL